MRDDHRLAELIEGLLPADEAAALELELEDDPVLGGRRLALERALAEPVQLPEVPVPPCVRWRVHAVAEAHLGSEVELERRPAREELAGALEGAEAPGLIEALRDPRVRAELLELAETFADGVPEVATPPGLLERVQVRLAEEGLADAGLLAAPEAAVPPGLLQATLERLEGEGLLAPSAAPQSLRAVAGGPRFRRWLAAAAALFVVGGLSAWVAYGEGRRSERALHDAQRPGLALVGDQPAWGTPERLRVALREAREERDVARSELEASRLGHASATAALGSAVSELQAVRVELATLDRDAERLRRELAASRSEVEVVALELSELRATRRASEELLARLELEAREQLAQLSQLATERDGLRQQLLRADRSQGLVVDASQAALRWEPGSGEWQPVAAGSQLPGGTVIRGEGRGALVVGGRRYPLRGSAFVISADLQLEPLPEASAFASHRVRPRSPEPRDLNAKVQRWVAELGSSSPQVRSLAQSRLLDLYERFGDPGPGVVERLLRSDEAAPGVPATARAWLVWWARVEPDTAGALK